VRTLFSKIVVIVILITCMVSGVAFALVYHVNDAAEAVKQEYGNEINSYLSERDEKIKNDVQDLTQIEIQRLRDETHQYLNQKINQDYQKELNLKSNEIKEVTNQKIEEIKEYIDLQMRGNSE
jgi:cell division protein FtsX